MVLGLTAGLLSAADPAWAGTSSLPSPSVTFATPGTKQVVLTVCNRSGCDTVTHSVLVLNPSPAITLASLPLTTVEAGQLVHFAGAGTGKPPLAYSWRVTPPAGPVLAVSGATPWWDTTGMAPGLYSVALNLSNGSGSVASAPILVTLLPAQASDFYTIAPCRAYDSRLDVRTLGTPLPSGLSLLSLALDACGIPADARALTLNVTVINPTAGGNAALYPGNYPQPQTSTITFGAGVTRASFAILPLATDGTGTLGLSLLVVGGGTAHVVLDVSGYFLPTPTTL